MLARHAWLDEWVDGIARDAAVRQRGQILKRHSNLAMQGSVASADLVFKIHGGFYDRYGSAPDAVDGGDGRVTVNNTFLIPRPNYAAAQLVPVSPPAAALPAASPAGPAGVLPEPSGKPAFTLPGKTGAPIPKVSVRG